MANVAVLNMAGAQVGTIELNDAIFGIEANEHVMHLAVVQYLANQRQGQVVLSRAHRAQKHALKFVAVVENLTDRKVLVEQDRAPSVPLSGLAVALYSLPSPEIIPSS